MASHAEDASRKETDKYVLSPSLRPAKETEYRRFSDRLLWGACAAVVTLMGAVWGITWAGTEGRVDKADVRIDGVERTGSQTSERVRALETQLPLFKEQVGEMRIEQRAMSGKLDQVLIELKKR